MSKQPSPHNDFRQLLDAVLDAVVIVDRFGRRTMREARSSARVRVVAWAQGDSVAAAAKPLVDERGELTRPCVRRPA
jgi:hypothetical protein